MKALPFVPEWIALLLSCTETLLAEALAMLASGLPERKARRWHNQERNSREGLRQLRMEQRRRAIAGKAPNKKLESR